MSWAVLGAVEFPHAVGVSLCLGTGNRITEQAQWLASLGFDGPHKMSELIAHGRSRGAPKHLAGCQGFQSLLFSLTEARSTRRRVKSGYGDDKDYD